MDAGSAAVLGAAIGGIAGVLGGVITQGIQSKTDRTKWSRDKQVEAYTSSIRYLVRIATKRSLITPDGSTVLGKDAMKEWFDDISEALAALVSLTIYCSEQERPNVIKGNGLLNSAAESFLQEGAHHTNITQVAHDVCFSISESARRDIGASVKSA